MICAMMLTAISSGVTEPMGTPTGMMTLSMSCFENPLSARAS